MLNDIFWYCMHRFHPKHRYNTIKMASLDAGYYDPDVRMLHACFDLFTEWFKYNAFDEKLITKETFSEHWDEAMELYLWWTVKHRDDELNSKTMQDRARNAEIEDEMLIRLIKIRRHIWYI